MSAIKIIQAYAKKSLTKNQGSGITTLPSQFMAESKAGEIAAILQQAGMPLQQLDNFIRSEADLLKFLNIIKNANKPRVIPGTSAEGKSITEKLFGKKGEVIEFPQKRSFKEEIDAMKKSGDIVDEKDMVISKKITDREMFKNSNLNKEPISEKFIDYTIQDINKKEPLEGMKIANKIIKREGEFKDLTEAQSKRILKETDDHLTGKDIDYDPEDFYAKGGRAGYYTGGITDVEPSLDDIGHGSDSLMARTRLVSPGSQATTSTGLNYLLAEDNDNIRVPFNAGGGGRRAFLKLMASIGGLTAAAKSGILGLGEGTTKKAITETVKQSAGSGMPPPYFFKLVKKIKNMGDDTTATQDRTIAKSMKSKDGKSEYILEEDQVTGDTIIKKVNKEGDEMITDVEIMEYRMGEPVKGKDGKVRTTPNEYEEVTEANARIEGDVFNDPYYSDGIQQTEIKKILDEVSDVSLEDIPAKADGGRIGFSAGGGKFLLSKLGINSTTTRFLEKVFGKQKFKNLIENDPEMHRGLLEVAEMFRSKDKTGLVEYMQNFLPQMSKKELENFIVGSGDTAGIEGQLIRLGSGRDYKGKLDMIEEANNVRKLENFDIEGVSKNAEGGRIGFSGGGILRAIIAKSAAKKGLSVTDFIKATNYKGLPPEIRMYISPEDFAKLKGGQKEMYDNYIDMAKTRLEFQKNVEGGMNTPQVAPFFKNLEKTMDEQSFVPKTVTADDIAEMELMVKNRFNKGRKDNAQGGIQTMLGE